MRTLLRFLALAPLSVVTACTRPPPEPAPLATTNGGVSAEAPAPKVAPAASCPSDPESKGPIGAPLTITFVEAKGARIDAELARTPAETERGLMYRTKMSEDSGMLFRLEKHVEHTFWMRNTCIPLDMLFVEDDGLIVGISESVPTLNDAPRSVGRPSSWVLEVNAGWSRRHGVHAGQHLVLPAAARL